VTFNHPHAMFRSGRRYERRPPANCKTARRAWDHFAKTGPVQWLQLLCGYWGALREDGSIEEVENVFSDRYWGEDADRADSSTTHPTKED
jgi:hypothetical protein